MIVPQPALRFAESPPYARSTDTSANPLPVRKPDQPRKMSMGNVGPDSLPRLFRIHGRKEAQKAQMILTADEFEVHCFVISLGHYCDQTYEQQ